MYMSVSLWIAFFENPPRTLGTVGRPGTRKLGPHPLKVELSAHADTLQTCDLSLSPHARGGRPPRACYKLVSAFTAAGIHFF